MDKQDVLNNAAPKRWHRDMEHDTRPAKRLNVVDRGGVLMARLYGRDADALRARAERYCNAVGGLRIQ